MSIEPEYDRVITLEPRVEIPEAAPPELPPAEPVVAPVVETAPKASKPRPKWLVPAAIAAVGLIASGTLGYLFYSTSAKLTTTQQRLAAMQVTLGSTKEQLSSLQADAASKKTVADYMSMYTVDAGKVRTDYELVVVCDNYPTCRTAAQQALTDMQSFQQDRQAANVPPSLSESDSQLGDSLSAGIVALQELISGMDNDQVAKIKDGFSKLDDSMLSMAKAEASLGAELK